MVRINLLPYREAKRKQEQATSGVVVFIAVLLVFAAYYGVKMYLDGQLEYQQQRVEYLKAQEQRLQKKIQEIANVKEQKESLLQKLDIVEQLQKRRDLGVRVLNALVHKTPAGVYLINVQENGGALVIEGYADSTGQVSEYMRALAETELLDDPTLEITRKVLVDELELQEFKLRTIMKLKKSKPEDDTAAADIRHNRSMS